MPPADKKAKRGRLGPERRAIVSRLVRSGCPIEYPSLLDLYSLRIYLGSAETNFFFPLSSGGTGFVCFARIVAMAPVTFDRFELRLADNTPIPVRWAEYCDEHESYCVHDKVYGGYKADRSINELGRWLKGLEKQFLTLGDEFKGYLVGSTSVSLPVSPVSPANLLLAFIDKFESEFLFPISLAANLSRYTPRSTQARALRQSPPG